MSTNEKNTNQDQNGIDESTTQDTKQMEPKNAPENDVIPQAEQIQNQEENQNGHVSESQSGTTKQDSIQQAEMPESQKYDSIKSMIRMGLEVVGCILILVLVMSNLGRVPKGSYDGVKKQYKELQKEYDDQSKELESVSRTLQSVRSEYEQYQSKMSKFDDLTDDEIDALIGEAEKITEEKKAAAEQAAAEEAAKKRAAESASIEQKNALNSAKQYLNYTAFSYSGLIGQLEYEGYSNEAATYAADNCGADWSEQAAKKAKEYIDYTSFSRQGLIDQLIYEGFSQEQAEHGASAVGY